MAAQPTLGHQRMRRYTTCLGNKIRGQCNKLNTQIGFHRSLKFPFVACRVVGVAAHVVIGQERLQLNIAAPLVFSCGGSLHGPALLLRSGIDVAGNVGRHLHLHPGASVAGQFSESAAGGKIRMWEVGQPTSYVVSLPGLAGLLAGPHRNTQGPAPAQWCQCSWRLPTELGCVRCERQPCSLLHLASLSAHEAGSGSHLTSAVLSLASPCAHNQSASHQSVLPARRCPETVWADHEQSKSSSYVSCFCAAGAHDDCLCARGSRMDRIWVWTNGVHCKREFEPFWGCAVHKPVGG